MASYDTLKSLAIFFGPILIPRAYSTYRSFRVSLSTRPPPKPLQASAARSLNILFCSAALFLILSFPLEQTIFSVGQTAVTDDIFKLTSSRFITSTGVLFTRLARLRPGGDLTPEETILQSTFTSPTARKLYLRFGAEPLISCPYCSLENPVTYLLYYLPFNTLIPHLFHLFIIGLATSAPLVDRPAARWRGKFLLGAAALLIGELALILNGMTSLKGPQGNYMYNNYPGSPPSFHSRLSALRPLAFTIFDAICAAVIYLSATNRFFFTPPTPGEQVDQILSMSTAALGSTMSKVQTLSVVRSVIASDQELKRRYDAYHDQQNDDWVWEDEKVVQAAARAMSRKAGSGPSTISYSNGDSQGPDLVQMGIDINAFVNGMTAGLEDEEK